MRSTLTLSLALVAAAAAAVAAPVGYTLGDNGRTLVRIGDLAGAAMLSGRPIVDAAGAPVSINAIDRRPKTGEVFGYSDGDNAVYRIDVATGVATRVASAEAGTEVGVSTVGFDFNNQIDRARVVSADDDNLVFNPTVTPGTLARFTTLGYAAGDANFGRDPGVFANAYTNAVADAPSTVQYVLDAQWDLLATLNNNAGQLTTVGALWSGSTRLDVTDNGGFDIFSTAVGDNAAYALLTDFAGVGLYALALAPDADGRVQASLLGRFGGDFGVLNGLTVVDEVAPVPLPAPALLLGAALAGFGLLRRRRRTV